MKKRVFTLILSMGLFLLLLLSGCGRHMTRQMPDPSDSIQIEEEAMSHSHSVIQRRQKPYTSLELGLDLLPFMPTGRSSCVSPASLQQALMLAVAGASGDTEKELKLFVGRDTATWLTPIPQTQAGQSVVLNVANAVWINSSLKIAPGYQERVTAQRATIATLPMQQNPSESATQINDWVTKQTHNCIQELITPDNFTPSTEAILTNAIYFQGKWLHAFQKSRTQEETFHATKGDQKVTFMHGYASLNYARTDELEAVIMPYKGYEFAMMIIMVAEGEDSNELLTLVTPSAIDELIESLQMAKVNISMPRFKISQDRSLREPLISLGLMDPFSNKAEFTRMTEDRTNLMLGDVVQKTLIKVDEEGTEAAAATGITMVRTAMPMRAIFCADKPFLYILFRERPEHALFVGVYDGEQSSI